MDINDISSTSGIQLPSQICYKITLRKKFYYQFLEDISLDNWPKKSSFYVRKEIVC